MSIITKSARGRDCTVRIPGYCNYNPETTVLAHKPGAGMGIKSNDMFAAFACSSCHDIVDGRDNNHSYSLMQVLIMFLEGMVRTQLIWLNEGLIQVKGDKTKKSIEWFKNNSIID